MNVKKTTLLVILAQGTPKQQSLANFFTGSSLIILKSILENVIYF